MLDDTTIFGLSRRKRLDDTDFMDGLDGQPPAVGAASGLEPRSVFETPDYRAVYNVARVIEIDVGDGVPLVFHDRDDHAVCLARTASLDDVTVGKACRMLFAQRRFRFAVFEDVHLPPPFAAPLASARFHYQNDWVLTLDSEQHGLRQSFRREMDRKLRRLRREFEDLELVLERPTRPIIEQAISLNRKRIEAEGGTYAIDDAKRERLVVAVSKTGIASVLRRGDHLISAGIFVECGREAYAILGGYDETYRRDSPGMQILRNAIDHFADRGFRAMHMMWGDGNYKAGIGASRMPLSTLIVPRSRLAWLGRRMLGTAIRYGFMDAKRHVKERLGKGKGARAIDIWAGKIRSALSYMGFEFHQFLL